MDLMTEVIKLIKRPQHRGYSIKEKQRKTTTATVKSPFKEFDINMIRENSKKKKKKYAFSISILGIRIIVLLYYSIANSSKNKLNKTK